MTKDELERILPVAREAAREAAQHVRKGWRRAMVVEHKGAVDLVTSFDRESEAILRARLDRALGIPVVGEETGGAFDPEAPAFFVDPIDGTTNFVHGHPFWCVSVGLVVRGVPVLGVVVAPALATEWYGFVTEAGEGRAERMPYPGASAPPGADEVEACAVSATPRFEDALLATGFPYDRRTSAENNFDAFVAIKRQCQAVRRCGSAALDLCLVADGTYEGYWERKLNPWDIAAGCALVRAAGGRVSDFEDGPRFMATGHVVATNGRIHGALLHQLANAPPLSFVPPVR
jgi:myo-inositol-1(or 4)-monophosphatase